MRTKKKILSLLLIFIMVLGLFPMAGLAYAAGDVPDTSVSSTSEADPIICNTFADVGYDEEIDTGTESSSAPLIEGESTIPIVEGSRSDGLDTNPGEVLIQFTKIWSGENATTNTRPESITIKLYKYIGAFDASSATLLETVTLKAEDDWKYTFDITSEALYDGNNNAYKFAVVEDAVPGYTDTAHTDPTVTFIPPTVNDGWERITPCSELQITSSGGDKSVVVSKLTQNQGFVVWTVDPLSEVERELIYNSVKNQSGMGNPSYSQFIFVSGIGASYSGMTVYADKIIYQDPSNWAMIWTGLYSKSSIEANACSITNTYSAVGSLVVTKTISGNAASTTKEFDFTVTLSDTTISGTYGDMNFVNGSATFTLKAGESATATDLPNGVSYTVEEADYTADGYVTTKTGDTGIIIGNDILTAVFTNTRNEVTPPLPQTGSLFVSKTVSGNGSSTTKTFTFTVTLDAGAGNTPINGEYGGMTFENGVATFMLKHGESRTATGIPAGFAYTVEESDNAGYTVTVNNTSNTSATGTIAADQMATAAFDNYKADGGSSDPNPASVRIVATKILDGSSPSGNAFTFTLKDENGKILQTKNNIDGIITFDDLSFTDVGTYTYTLEEVVKGTDNGISYDSTVYTISVDVTLSGDYQASVSYLKDGQEYDGELIFANETKPGSLVVSKTVSGGGASISKEFTFTVTLNGGAGNSINDVLLLSEINESVRNTVTYSDVEFVNGVAIFTLKHGESKTISGLPAGFTYLVEESDNSGYTVTVNSTSNTTATGTIVAGETATAAFNNYKAGGSGGYDPDPATVRITATKTLDGAVPSGSEFSFTLKDENGNIVQSKNNNGGNITFDTLSFFRTGTYKYTLEEVAGSNSNIKYDRAAYEVTIEVTKSGDYHAAVSYEKDGAAYTGTPAFANTTKQTPPVNLPADDTVSVSVNKVWSDSNSKNRPSSVSVQLYRNGSAYGNPVTLSESNGWRYTWSNLDEDYTWTVDEVGTPSRYTKSVTHSGNSWTITNTMRTPDVVPKTGDNSNMGLWLAFATLSMLGVIGTLLGKKYLIRRNK